MEKQENTAEKCDSSPEVLRELFVQMRDALEELDIDGMESVIHEMENYRFEDSQEELFGKLKDAVDEIDVDVCEEIIDCWEESIF